MVVIVRPSQRAFHVSVNNQINPLAITHAIATTQIRR